MENKKEPIRILQCVSNMDRAGIETMLMNYYRNIDKSKIQFDFLCNKSKPGDYDAEIRQLGGKIYVSPGLNPIKWYKYQKYMKNLFNEHPEYRIIHCQNETMGFYALKAAKDCNVPVRIAHSHNTVIRKDAKFLIKWLCKKMIPRVANLEVACGRDAGIFLFGKEVKIIRNSIDTKKFIYDRKIREEIRKKLGITADKYVIGCVARFEPQKNHSFLIDVFYKYSINNPNAILLLIGEGTLEKKIHEKIKLYNIENKVIFTGSISNVNEYYNAMDIFVLTSHHEGLPVVVIEAQTNSLPCLISNKVTGEIKVNDNVEFLTISKVEPWTQKLELYKNSERIDKSKKIVDAGYDIKEEAKKIEIWYEKLNNYEIK